MDATKNQPTETEPKALASGPHARAPIATEVERRSGPVRWETTRHSTIFVLLTPKLETRG